MPTQRTGTGRSTTFFDDPPEITLAGAGTDHYFDSPDGVGAAVAPANHGRLRYNNVTKKWQASVDGNPYSDISIGPSTSPWTESVIGVNPVDTIFQVTETALVVVGDTDSFDGGNSWDQYKFNIRGGSDAEGPGLVCGISCAADAVPGAALVGLKSRGTFAAPAVLVDADKILSLYAAGYSTGRLRDCGQLHFIAGPGWAAGGSTDSPCQVILKTVLEGDGNSLTDRLVIDGNGLATFSHGIETGANVTVNGTLFCTVLDAGSLSFSTITLSSHPSIITMDTMPFTAFTGGPDGNTFSFVDADTVQLGVNQADANQRGFLYRKNDGSAGGGMYLSGLDTTPLWRLFVGGEGGGNVELSVTDAGATFASIVHAFGASGGTGQTAINIPNGRSLSGKTSGGGGVACDLVMLYTDNVLYIGDANVSGGVSIQSSKNAFFGAAPVSKPTGVAVTAAGIHAALVTLNLIAA